MLDRTKAPETYEIDAVTLQIAEVQLLPNGVKLHLIKNETQPVIRLDFVFKAGKWYESESGVSDLTAKMLLEGSLHYTAKQIAEQVAYYGASFDSNHGYDRTELTLYCLSKHLKELLPLVTDVIQNPVFPEEEFQQLKQRTIQNLKVQKQKSSYLATQELTRQLYGATNPYVFGFEEERIAALTLSEIKQFYTENYSTNTLEVFACGDLNEKVWQELTDALQELKIDVENSIEAIHAFLDSQPKESIVLMPESLQSSIRVGKRFPLIQHEDYLKLKILNEILGGYFGSRLMRNIREDKGYTYGIHSVISPKEKDSMFYIGTDVNYAVTDKTIEEIRKEILTLQQEEVPEDELHVVKNYMLGKFINDIATIFDQCDKYKRVVLHGLNSDHYNRYVTTIRTITAPELKELAQKYLDINSLQIAIAGRKAD
ncbi:insulinase family protein [Pontibacter qinzhouensis]|uniref:Insulinase family protein n=1 Tax=Pontibacter qinzhouensis TaxID=2603253 RepID=A0A5C8K5Q6_9BACT|nr:pitrilysin family protein [Pontibacter qinzhouensis]TXK46060.1 insulinase family protein [Pontibacter qinzhouensis]